MTALAPLAVEIDKDLPILKLRDFNGYELRYLLADDGNLVLGKVFLQTSRDGKYRVTFFVPAAGDLPIVLKIEPTG